MLERVEGDAAGPQRGVVAELVGDKAVRRLVKGHRKDRPAEPRCSPGRPSRASAPSAFMLRPPPLPTASASNRASAAARSKPSARARGAAPRRARAARRPAGVIGRRGRGDLLHLVELAVAMQGKIAAGGERPPRPLAEAAAERPHREIVGHQHAVEADLAADDLVDHARATASPARCRIDRAYRRCARSSPRASSASARNGAKSVSRQLVAAGLDHAAGRDGCRRGRGRGRACA